MGWKYTEEVLRDAVSHSVSYVGVLRYLGVPEAGGSHTHISRTVKRLGIDTSHFTGQAWRRGLPSDRRKTPGERVLRAPGSPRENGERLRGPWSSWGSPTSAPRAPNCQAVTPTHAGENKVRLRRVMQQQEELAS